jgi:hypothetical protein
MKLLWANFSWNPEQLASPAWHGEVLRSRREQVLQGQASIHSWDAAIGELSAEMQGHQPPRRRQGGSPQWPVLLQRRPWPPPQRGVTQLGPGPTGAIAAPHEAGGWARR